MRTYDFDKQSRGSWKHLLDLAMKITLLFNNYTTNDRPTPIAALLKYVAAKTLVYPLGRTICSRHELSGCGIRVETSVRRIGCFGRCCCWEPNSGMNVASNIDDWARCNRSDVQSVK